MAETDNTENSYQEKNDDIPEDKVFEALNEIRNAFIDLSNNIEDQSPPYLNDYIKEFEKWIKNLV